MLLALLGGGCSPLTAFDALVPKDAGSRRIVTGATYGGDALQRLDVYAPVSRGSGRQPVIVFFYGGAWSSGTRSGYAFVGRALAARGFIVVVPDYRLVPAVRFPAFVQDGAAALRWTRAHISANGGDPERIVLMGHSAGAYIAAMLALDPQWLGSDRAAVKGWVGLAGPYDFLPLDDPATIAAFAGWRPAAETQPGNFIDAGDPPALLGYGAEDARVRPRNSIRLARRMRATGVAVDLRAYPGIGHVGIVTALARPWRRRAPVLADVAAFVAG